MKTVSCLLLVSFVLMIGSCGRVDQPPQTKQEAEVRVDRLLAECDRDLGKEHYAAALTKANAILDICSRFSVQQDRLWDITDRKLFALQKLGNFDEALKVALALEEMPLETGNRKSAWNYLKIADCYLGMHDSENAVNWIEKAVYERGFQKYQIFQNEEFSSLTSDERFQKVIRHMKDHIGLQHPAKDFSVRLLDGEQFRLSSQRGRVVLVDFWDVACPPCIKAMPELKELFNRYHKDGLEIIGISLDTDKELLKSFLEKNDIPWKTACSYDGWKDTTAVLYGVSATPSTWLIDRDGVLQYYNVREEELRSAVRELVER